MEGRQAFFFCAEFRDDQAIFAARKLENLHGAVESAPVRDFHFHTDGRLFLHAVREAADQGGWKRGGKVFEAQSEGSARCGVHPDGALARVIPDEGHARREKEIRNGMQAVGGLKRAFRQFFIPAPIAPTVHRRTGMVTRACSRAKARGERHRKHGFCGNLNSRKRLCCSAQKSHCTAAKISVYKKGEFEADRPQRPR